MSKVGAVMGREGDATPFTEVTVDNISNTLHSYVPTYLQLTHTWLSHVNLVADNLSTAVCFTCSS